MTLRLVYISGPYTSASAELVATNIQRACSFGEQARQAGAVPLVPHVAVMPFPGLSVKEAWGPAMQECLRLLEACDGMLLCPGWETSRGCRVELAFAEEWKIPVFHTIDELSTWLEIAA